MTMNQMTNITHQNIENVEQSKEKACLREISDNYIKKLNKAVFDHLKKCINENPNINVAPIIEEYIVYINDHNRQRLGSDDENSTNIVKSKTVHIDESTSIEVSNNCIGSDSSDDSQNNDVIVTSPSLNEMPSNEVYSVKCSLHYKNENKWYEKGAGILYITESSVDHSCITIYKGVGKEII